MIPRFNIFNSIVSQKSTGGFYIELEKNGIGKNIAKYDMPMVNIRYFRGLAFYHNNMTKSAFEDFQFCLSKNFNNSIVQTLYGSNIRK